MRIDKLTPEVSNTDSWLDLAKLISRERRQVSANGEDLAGAERVRDVFYKNAL